MNRNDANIWRLPAATAQLLDDFEFAFLILKHGIASNMSGFSLVGLQSPFEIKFGQGGTAIEIGAEDFDGAFAGYTERVYERIASLTDNVQMISAVRGFIDRTRQYRHAEAKNRAHFEDDARGLLLLTDAVMRLDVGDASASLDAQLARHADRLSTLTGTTENLQRVQPLANGRFQA